MTRVVPRVCPAILQVIGTLLQSPFIGQCMFLNSVCPQSPAGAAILTFLRHRTWCRYLLWSRTLNVLRCLAGMDRTGRFLNILLK